jgi:membrane associated rhomboid family serine protease
MFPIRDTIPSRNKPVITKVLIIINVLSFFFQLTGLENGMGGLIHQFGFVPREFYRIITGKPILLGIYYPLVTGLFLHGGFFHLISNMWALWIFGDNVEDSMGHRRFLSFYLLSGIIANLSHFLFNPLSPIPAIGASGAIAGVMGAYLIMFPFARITTLIPILIFPIFVNIPAVVYLFIWFISQLYSGAAHTLMDGTMAGGVAWWAHVGGFLAGIILCKRFIPSGNRKL